MDHKTEQQAWRVGVLNNYGRVISVSHDV